jgi:hypothetical protein
MNSIDASPPERLPEGKRTGRAVSKSAKRTFFVARKTIFHEKISLNVSCHLAKPACIAGVLISDPSFSPL